MGFCDETDNGLEYVMNMDILYLEFDDFMIRLESVENYSKLLIMVEDKICQDYIIDEDMHYAFSKLHNIIFKYGEMAVVYIEKIWLYNIHNQTESKLTCDAMKIYLSNGQVIFYQIVLFPYLISSF